MIEQASNILVCLRYGIGDLVMELPALEHLRALRPRARITGLGASPAIELLQGDPRIDDVASIQDRGISHWGYPADEPSRRRIEDWLRRNDFDLILDPSHSALAVWQAVHRVTDRIMELDSDRQNDALRCGADGVAAIKQGVLHGWGIQVPPHSRPRIPLNESERRWASEFLEACGLAARPVAAVSPSASHRLKRWPHERFAHVCDRLVQDHDFDILMLCGPGQDDLPGLCRRWMTRPDRLAAVHNQHLRRIAALLEHSALYVGHDSGLMHLAAAMDTPVAIIFGPTHPGFYLPRWVPSAAAAPNTECPCRRRDGFGHADCVVADRCLTGEHCICTVSVDDMMRCIRQVIHESRTAEGTRGPQ